MIVQYIKSNKNGKYSKSGKVLVKPSRVKKGVMVAVPVSDNEIGVGWSLCNFSKGDKYDQNIGIAIAVGRAKAGKNKDVPHSISKDFERFVKRVSKYYKNYNVKY